MGQIVFRPDSDWGYQSEPEGRHCMRSGYATSSDATLQQEMSRLKSALHTQGLEWAKRMNDLDEQHSKWRRLTRVYYRIEGVDGKWWIRRDAMAAAKLYHGGHWAMALKRVLVFRKRRAE